MARRGKRLNEEMWHQAVEWWKGGLTFTQICGRLSRPENIRRFGLEEVPSEDTVNRQVVRRLAREAFSQGQKARPQDTDKMAQESSEAIDTAALLVNVETTCQGYRLKSHPHTSSLDPFSIFFSVRCRGQAVVTFLQLHVWFLAPFVFWNPDRMDSLAGLARATANYQRIYKPSPSSNLGHGATAAGP